MKKALKQFYKEHKGKLSDKWSLYLTEFDRLFDPYRSQPIRLLEIGIQNGGSLEIWGKYFPGARKIIGCDIDPRCAALRYRSPRIAVVIGNANSDECEGEILRHASTLDVIIDDGSHKSSDIIRSFARYFPHLNDDGIYVVEDLHCSYWNDFEGGLHYPLSVMSFFKRLADIINQEHWRNNESDRELVARFGVEYGTDFKDLDFSTIHSIEFVNSICAIRKAPPEKNQLGKRVVVGTDESVTSGFKQNNGADIQDLTPNINDVGNLDVFELITHNNSLLQSTQNLAKQVTEKEHVIQALTTQVTEKEHVIQAFTTQVTEKERAMQALTTQVNENQQELLEIKASKSWKLAMLFRHIRLFLAPHNSRRAHILRRLASIFSPLRKIRRYLEFRQASPLIQASGLFDQDWYLANNPDVAQAKIDPLFHFIFSGGFEGRDPGPKFSSAWYLNTYADVKDAGVNPLVHYLRYGRSERRAIQTVQGNIELANSSDEFDRDWYLKSNPDIAAAGIDPYHHYMNFGRYEGRLGCFPKDIIHDGGASFEPSRDTVLVVSHEASRTGAPILSLNIVQRLQKKYNVISLLLGAGSIVEDFRRTSTFVVGPVPSAWNPVFATQATEQVMKSYKIKFAIVNSIVSYAVLPTLAEFFVPAISLIHEFSIYARPKGVVVWATLWSTELIFSTSVIHENAVFDNPALENHPFRILPQGQCTPLFENSDIASSRHEKARVLKILRPEGSPEDMVVVLGVGMVQIRKGVDLFIDCAARVMRSVNSRKFRFVWIGTGYDPEVDLNYSMYLADQIQRAGLQNHVFFMEETANIEAVYDASDVLLISSRLDPLPNIGIDAMMRGVPLVCFEKTTGIADILIANGLGEECVAPYLDTAKMASQVMAFAASKSLCQRVGKQMQQIGRKEFDMDSYVSKLEQIGLASSDRMLQEQMDVLEIKASGLARLDFFLPAHLKEMSLDEAIRYYVRTWASGIERRKLFPGFHPGIFREQYTLAEANSDPLANYIRAGQPAGPWGYDVITTEGAARPLPPELRIALHLHVYYPDLLPDILERLNANQVRPDLFISVPTEVASEEVQAVLLENYLGKVIEIQVVPNRGRDIGPFLSAFGAAFVKHYDVVGHLHTKKTTVFKDESIGKGWHTFLMENLLGGKSNMADVILDRLANDPSIGIIFPDDPNAEPYVVGWGHNKPYAETLLPRLGLNILPENLLFPVGAMFWARVEALLPVFGLNLEWQDYPTEPLPYDGSILHALERLLPFVVAKQGFRSMLTNVAGITR